MKEQWKSNHKYDWSFIQVMLNQAEQSWLLIKWLFFSEADSEDLVVIREVYDSDNAQEIFEMELERAIQVWQQNILYNLNFLKSFIFQSGCKTIIIEPTQLGEDTERWISYGNYLRRSAVVAGMASIMVGFYWEDKTFLPLPLGFTSSLCASLYTVCWAFDPCSLYKVFQQ